MATNFKIETDADGIALITWDMPGRSMNVFTPEVHEELSALVEQVAGDAAIKGAVITSGKDSFCAGADLTMLEQAGKAFAETAKSKGERAAMSGLYEETRKPTLLFRRLETCGKPFVAAINGTAVGGGFELTLACHYRVASQNPKTRVGLPEVKVGLMPGAGGTQRIARMLPQQDALMFLTKGDQIDVGRAAAAKLIDAVVPAEELIKAAKDWIKAGGSAVKPWDQKGFRLPDGPVYSPKGMMFWPAANALYRKQTFDNYPGARGIMKAVYEGLLVPMDAGLRIESRYFAQVLRTPEANAMIRSLFLSMQELNKGARRPAGVPPTRVNKLGIIGAGFMGASVGFVSAQAGIEVVLIDRDQAAADKGKAHASAQLDEAIKKGRASEADKTAVLSRITATADYSALAGCDLVIEAVFEDRTVKAEAIKKAQEFVGKDTIFASNTSTLPITSLAGEFTDPKRFVGIHFFSPVEKMMLVEIIRGKKTADPAVAAALDYVRQIKKTPIVVNDSRGFFASRVVTVYVREAHLMLLEGVPPAMIENVARMAGMPVGPLALNDEVAIDLSWKILKATEADLGEKAIDPQQKELLQEMVEKRGRYGRKNKKGFYDYPDNAPKRLWPELVELQKTKLDPEKIDVEELKQRFLAVQAVEAARCIAEGVVVDPREADVGSILGFGYAPYTGGVVGYIDMLGTAKFVALCKTLAKKYGQRFKPPKLLVEMADKGETIYGRFAPAKQEKAA
jgi:3-hydroxyacyl-CoA dehydrogenase/enoyl-CoA hydratase/3-hydroxybutyryl-CoA epimerase